MLDLDDNITNRADSLVAIPSPVSSRHDERGQSSAAVSYTHLTLPTTPYV